jgi:fimbrial chaperone protein
MSIRKNAVKKISLFVFIIGISQFADAGYSMTPLITILEPSKNITSAEVVIKFEKGDAKIPIAVELKVKGREVSRDGSKIIYWEDKSTDNFVVYPSQIVLLPGESQRVQIKWVGDAIPKKEIAYGLIAEQAPVKLGDEENARIKAEGRLIMLLKYEGVVVVRPAGVRPNTVVDSVGSKVDSTGATRLVLVLSNKGTALQKFFGMKLHVTPLDKNNKMVMNKSVEYKPVLKPEQTKHSIFAGFCRKIDVAWPDKLPVGPVNVLAEFETVK